jgi:hypothetical protein
MAKAVALGMARARFAYGSFRDIVEVIPTEEFLRFDDTYFFTKSWEYAARNPASEVARLVERIVERHPLKLVYEFRAVAQTNEAQYQKYLSVQKLFTRPASLEDLARQACVNPGQIIVDVLPPVELVPLGPDISAEAIDRIALEGDRSEEARQIQVAPRLFEEGNPSDSWLLVSDAATLIHHLAKCKLYVIRVYLTTDEQEPGTKLADAIRVALV